jgi:energy-coupling factor transporter ATP-binding protein EcfA2
MLHADPGTLHNLARRIAQTRERMFTGRAAELELFRDALTGPNPPFAVLAIHGPGGTGKSMLLNEFARIARNHGTHPIVIDGRAIEASPLGFLSALDHERPNSDSNRLVVLIDTFEVLEPLEPWLRDVLIPSLPANSLVVLAGRKPPGPQWRSLPGLRDLVHIHPLRNLDPDESRAFLGKRGIHGELSESVLSFTHGHPLALSLVADVVDRSNSRFDPVREPDVVRVLLEKFIEEEPSPTHRQALEISVHARVTTESLLADAQGPDTGHAMFRWLQGLSFMQHGGEGLIPHDLVREVLEADLRWRYPERFEEVHRTVHDYLVKRIRQTSGREQQSLLHSLMFLHRHNPLWQPYHGEDQYGFTWFERAEAEDYPQILDMVERHEGACSAAIAEHWIRRQPSNFMMVRTVTGETAGFLGVLMLDEATDVDWAVDPAVEAITAYMGRAAPIRTGERVPLLRFAMGNDRYRNASTPMSVSTSGSRLIYSMDRIAWMFVTMTDPEFWVQFFSYVGFPLIPEAAFEAAGHTYGVFGHDWRAEPIEDLDRILTKREVSRERTLDPPTGFSVAPLIVLSRAEFDMCVRQVFRSFHRPHDLASNPLLRSRLVQRRGCAPSSPVVLLDLVRDAASRLRQSARTARSYDALACTYFDPAPSQELAAEQLDMPFSTYRRHLTFGIKFVTDELWSQEIG